MILWEYTIIFHIYISPTLFVNLNFIGFFFFLQVNFIVEIDNV